MPHTLDQILPSLQSLGILDYWLIALAAGLEAFFVTGAVVPGTLIVDAGGILVQRHLLDFFDLVWFVALGSVLGSELGYWTGRLAMARLPGRHHIVASRAFTRAQLLFRHRGGAALVLGRFFGPVSGLIPLVAAMAGMDRRRFLIWNIVGSIPYAFVHVTIGFFLGDMMERVGGSFTRLAVLVGAVAFLLVVLWALLYSALRLMPFALTILSAALRSLGDLPAVRRRIEAHPRASAWIAARFDSDAFTGLPLSGLVLIFLYTATIWLDSTVDFLSGDPMLALDTRLAELLHAFRSPVPVHVATWITATGGWQVIWPLMMAALVWLLQTRRIPLAAGLLVSVLGSTISVAILKLVFQRPRSPLGYFLETSNSFPSGHAAASIGFYGMLMYVFWRAGKLRAETALLSAGLAAFAIGLSRIYLIEHYLSDVLNGWLVGLLWLLVGIAVSEWLASKRSLAEIPWRQRPRWHGFGIAASILMLGLAALNVARYDHPRNIQADAPDRVLSDPQALAGAEDFPAITESLLGSPLRPISLIVLAPDASALRQALLAAGWKKSEPPTPGIVLHALYSAFAGREDPTVRTVSHFWRGEPNDLSFVSPAEAAPDAPDNVVHARFWRSEYVTPDGRRAFAGSVGSEAAGAADADPVPAGDAAARDRLIRDLETRGATVSPPVSLQAPGSADRISGATPVLTLP